MALAIAWGCQAWVGAAAAVDAGHYPNSVAAAELELALAAEAPLAAAAVVVAADVVVGLDTVLAADELAAVADESAVAVAVVS